MLQPGFLRLDGRSSLGGEAGLVLVLELRRPRYALEVVIGPPLAPEPDANLAVPIHKLRDILREAASYL